MTTIRTTLPTLITLLVVLTGGSPNPTGKVAPALRHAASASEPKAPLAAWVFFSDKGGKIQERLSRAEAELTPRARARRERNLGTARLVDYSDIPVDPAYVAGVKGRVLRIRQTSRWLNAVSVEVEAGRVQDLAALPFVRRLDVVRSSRLPEPDVESAPPREPGPARMPGTVLDYGNSFTQNDIINTIPLHNLGYNGHGVLICMLDAGFNNLGHDAFRYMDILITRDFVNGDSIVSDQAGQMGTGNHGTYTLSTIGGYAPGEVIGPAWGATYALAKTENTFWERHIEEDAWVAGAEWADSMGADIISSSLGYRYGFTDGETDYTYLDMDGNTAIATIGADIAASHGILVVNSAGNNGFVAEPQNTLIAPADGDSVLTVGAVDGAGVRASFSSVGYTADGRVKPDVMAMGVNVRAASASDPSAYVNANGTSFSCPLTAGAAALLLEANPSLTAAQIIDALRSTASQSGSPDRFMGWGIVDAAAAASITATGAGGETPPPSAVALHQAFPNPFNPTTTIQYDLPSPVRVTLAIYDIRGRLVTTLVDEPQSAGRKTVVWNGTTRLGTLASSGVYVCRLVAGDVQRSHKMVLLK